MARGYIYEISDNLNDYWLGNMNSDMLSADYAPAHFEYCSDVIRYQDDPDEIKDFIKSMQKYGFRTGVIKDPENESVEIPWFEASNFGKRNYFRNRLNRAREALNQISLDQFSGIDTSISTDSPSLTTIINEIRNDSEDAVYFNTAFEIMDDFIRNLRPDVKYYIGNVCLMH